MDTPNALYNHYPLVLCPACGGNCTFSQRQRTQKAYPHRTLRWKMAMEGTAN